MRKIIIHTAIALLCLGPLLWQTPYLFTLDSVIVPHMPFPEYVTASFLYTAAIAVLSTIVPSFILQKIILVAIIVTAGWGAQALTRFVFQEKTIFYSIASLVYVFNPFTYSRFMTGQFSVLLGYALLPFALLTTLRFLATPSIKTIWQPIIIVTLVAIFSIHTLGLVVLLVLPCVALYLYRNRQQLTQYGRKLAAYGSLGLLAFLTLNSYWLLPIFSGVSRTTEIINHFTQADFAAFALNDNGLGTIGNALTLRGFWADASGMYRMPETYFWWWLIPLVLLLVLVGSGFHSGLKKQPGLSLTLGVAGASALGIAIATSLPALSAIHGWLHSVLPFLAGYREPQKFLAITALCYAVFSAQGAFSIYKKLRHHEIVRIWNGAIIAIPCSIGLILTAPFMIWGFAGQLRVGDYPKDWYALRSELAQEEYASILFLPWHQYMDFDFAGRIIANPAQAFFANKTTISADPELKGSHAYKPTALQRTLDQEILPHARQRDLGARWQDLTITYIVLAKEADYKKYSFLDNQSTITFIKETDHLKLYEIRGAIK